MSIKTAAPYTPHHRRQEKDLIPISALSKFAASLKASLPPPPPEHARQPKNKVPPPTLSKTATVSIETVARRTPGQDQHINDKARTTALLKLAAQLEKSLAARPPHANQEHGYNTMDVSYTEYLHVLVHCCADHLVGKRCVDQERPHGGMHEYKICLPFCRGVSLIISFQTFEETDRVQECAIPSTTFVHKGKYISREPATIILDHKKEHCAFGHHCKIGTLLCRSSGRAHMRGPRASTWRHARIQDPLAFLSWRESHHTS